MVIFSIKLTNSNNKYQIDFIYDKLIVSSWELSDINDINKFKYDIVQKLQINNIKKYIHYNPYFNIEEYIENIMTKFFVQYNYNILV